ncbi:hypothetical protein K0I63_11785 [Shewanella rhizosphaerae]|uniref:hypothetical protein n=1 Tax=Shewanella rhizosphaerae TaxID=2864207 RepID=UPI001C65CDDE|nr:hypothetical protein [Shewanella rhizosphaerae]QYK11470.1 hypothetical protein K0I63_11785 [Shewanella rhizosphaerae]
MGLKKLLISKILFVALLLLPIYSFAQGCFQSSILSPSPFMGNDGEIFKLDDGSMWEVKYEYEYLYEYYPSVVICPGKGKLIIGDKSLNVEMISSAGQKENGSPSSASTIESQIDGDFEGFEGETIIKLMNGQIWQQSEYWYHYHYSFMPKVLIYKQGGSYKIKVDGIDKSVGVIRLH